MSDYIVLVISAISALGTFVAAVVAWIAVGYARRSAEAARQTALFPLQEQHTKQIKELLEDLVRKQPLRWDLRPDTPYPDWEVKDVVTVPSISQTLFNDLENHLPEFRKRWDEMVLGLSGYLQHWGTTTGWLNASLTKYFGQPFLDGPDIGEGLTSNVLAASWRQLLGGGALEELEIRAPGAGYFLQPFNNQRLPKLYLYGNAGVYNSIPSYSLSLPGHSLKVSHGEDYIRIEGITFNRPAEETPSQVVYPYERVYAFFSSEDAIRIVWHKMKQLRSEFAEFSEFENQIRQLQRQYEQVEQFRNDLRQFIQNSNLMVIFSEECSLLGLPLD